LFHIQKHTINPSHRVLLVADKADDLLTDVRDDLVDKAEVVVTIVVVGKVVLNQSKKNLRKYFFKYLVLQK
jgi:hypothetical protein